MAYPKIFITDIGFSPMLTDEAGKEIKLGRYGVWEHDGRKPQVIEQSDIFEGLKKKYNLTDNDIYKVGHNTFKPKASITASFEEQLKIGREVEREHLESIKWLIKEFGVDLSTKATKKLIGKMIDRIAIDHLKESGKYYTILKEMEKQFKKD